MRWPKACLGDVAQVVSGATPKSSVDHYWDGDIAWITPADLSNLACKEVSVTPRRITAAGLSSCSARLLPARSVLFSSRAPIGHVAINTVPMATNQGFKSFVPDHEILSPDFLYWWLKSNKSYLQSLGRGATFKEVSKEIVESIEIPLPPLEEQRRIAAILDRIANLLRLSESACTLNETLQESFFVDSFGEFRQASAKYPVLKLEDICSQITDGEHQTPLRSETGVKLLSARNIRNGRLDFSNVDHVPTDEFARIGKRCAPVRGDVLISCSGSIGRVAVVDTDEPLAMVRSAAMARPIQDKVRPLYLEFLLRSKHLQQCMQRSANASSQANLFQGKIRALPVFVPSLEEQDSFVARVSKVRASTSILAGRSIEIKALMQSAQNAEFFDVVQR